MKVLGIETSCDDTSIALIEGSPESKKLIYHQSFSQEDLLSKWGGVVPEIAARNHVVKLKYLLTDLLKTNDLSTSDIDLIGVTTHPGLLGPLLTGLNTAKSLSLINKTPIIGVNHLYAHLEAIHIDQKVSYPYLGLLVSGGHTLLTYAHSSKKFEILASTVDDAAGEAFDKAGKMMNMSYPAGREIDELAKKGDALRYPFSIAMKDSLNMSFSGIKTALNRLLDKEPSFLQVPQNHFDLCASYQECIVQTLFQKTKKKLKKISPAIPIVVGGGVACNSRLREVFKQQFKSAYFVSPSFCTDNAAMIANFALINSKDAAIFPLSLDLKAKNRFIEKSAFNESK